MTKRPKLKTINCTCNDVKNDFHHTGGKSFVNVKDGAGFCFCVISDNITGKSTKAKAFDYVILSERVKKK